MMLASTLDNIGILDAAIVALLGYGVVFFGLILLMGVIIIMGKAFMAKDKKAAAKAAAKEAVQ
jgi:Na+-transporting methylmalonyl-CoA/oxaloacetate decarboxylase gamma subunit